MFFGFWVIVIQAALIYTTDTVAECFYFGMLWIGEVHHDQGTIIQ
jgi:hypothetical protein